MPVLCLVPTPLAAARAARRLCDAEGGILFGPQVSTLERLVPGLLAAAGDRRAPLTPLAERILAVEAARAAGGPLGDARPDAGIAAALTAALGELRAGEISPSAARSAARELEGGAAERLLRLAAALEAFEARLDALGVLDRAGALRAAADAADRGARSAETGDLDLLVLDGHVALGPAEWDLVVALATRARRTRVHLPFFPDRPDLSAPVEPLLRRLEALHELARRRDLEIVLPRLEDRAARPAALLAAYAGGRARTVADGGEVRAVAGAGDEGEAAVIAALAAELLDRGFAPDEIAVVAPAPRRLAPRLAAACAEGGVPFAGGRGAPASEAPAVRTVLEALSAASRGLGRREAERLLGSTYLAPRDARLAPLLDRAGALEGRLPPAVALRRRAAALSSPAAVRERVALERAAAALEGIEAALRPLSAETSARGHAARLSVLLDATGIRRRAARGDAALAARDLGALARVEEAADAVARAVALAGRGTAQLPAEDFRALLVLALDALTLAPAEPVAGAVELWAVEDAPGLEARAVIAAGCGRAGWPAPPGPEPLLREPERLALNRALGRAALATAAARRAEALHRTFAALAAGREVVAVTWSAPGPGGSGGPLAPVVHDALTAVGIAPPTAPEPAPALSACTTVRSALRAAARLGPVGAAALAGTPLEARLRSARDRGAVEAARRDSVRGRSPASFAGAIAGPARDVLRAELPREWAPTTLESYARCPFRLFLQLAVRLPDPEGDGLDIDPRHEGSVLHAVLERFVRDRIGRRAWPPAGGAEDLAEAHAAAESVFARFEREGRVGDPAVWAARREVVLARLERVVRAEADGHDGLVPALVEHRFGGDAERPALALECDGERVLVKGRIDRVDAADDRLLVIDYKSGSDVPKHRALLEDDAMGTTNFQVPLYLMAAARDLPGRERLGATYALLKRAERLDPFSLDAADPRLAAAAGAPGSSDPARACPEGRPFAAAVVDVVRRIRDGAFPIASRDCAHCPFGAVCRFEGASGGAEDGA